MKSPNYSADNNTFADLLVEKYGKNGVSVEALVKKKRTESILTAEKDKTGKHHALSYEEAFDEVVADSCEDFLADSNIQQTIVEFAKADKSLASKIKEFVKGLIEKLENAIKGLHGQSAEAEFLRDFDTDELEELKSQWTSALFDARENVLQAKSKEAKESKAQKNTTGEGDVKQQARYAKQGGLFSIALTGAEWIKYNHSMTTEIDAGLRISDHSVLVECEKGDYTYKLVIYDKRLEDSPINGVYGIGKNLYNEDISNFDAKLIGEFITNLEEQKYDNKQTLERILRYYSRNVGYVLGRYNSKSGRFNKFGHKVSGNTKGSRQKTNGAGVYQRVGKTQINSDDVKRQNRDSLIGTLNRSERSYFANSKIRNENDKVNPDDNEDTKFSLRSNVEETKDLVAVHNMQIGELEKSLDLGGLPMPSIAIIKAKSGHSEYGDVSLVFNKIP